MKSFTGALAALFSLHMEAEEPDAAVFRERPAIFEQPASPAMSSSSGRKKAEDKLPLLLSKPARKTLMDMRSDPNFPRLYNVVIENDARRIPYKYMEGMLQRIFHERADRAGYYAAYAQIIHCGPYTLDVAETKIRHAEADAIRRVQPVPRMACEPLAKIP